MQKKYNLALVPLFKSNEVVTLSKKLSGIADKYILGENSLPHVTLYQFKSSEQEINALWKLICETWKEKPIDLKFDKFSYKKYKNDIFWISLLPDHHDDLHRMHGIIANMLSLAVKESFEPHMTLINTKNTKYQKEAAMIAVSYQPFSDSFILALGACDDVGQLTEIIHRF